MLKRLLIFSTLVLFATVTVVASDRDDDVSRTQKAAQIFSEITNNPDQRIPRDLVQRANCIAIIPGDVKFASIYGGNFGRGLATCHTGHGWSAPVFLAVDGGTGVGYQTGGFPTALVMLFMNAQASQVLVTDKFTVGGNATVAAGPVGQRIAPGAGQIVNADILTYSRAKGVFAGVNLEGTVVQADRSGDHAMYGDNADRHEILNGDAAIPASAQPLLDEIATYDRAPQ